MNYSVDVMFGLNPLFIRAVFLTYTGFRVMDYDPFDDMSQSLVH